MTETIKEKINKVLTFINKNYSSGAGVKTYDPSQATLDMDYRLQQPFFIVQFRKIMYFA